MASVKNSADAGFGRLAWMPVRGQSMAPAIRPGDWVRVDRCSAVPLAGEVVVVRTAGGFVAHRVLSAGRGFVTLRGDNCLGPDSPVRVDEVVGTVESVRRKGKVLSKWEWDVGPTPFGPLRVRLARRLSRVTRAFS